MDIWFIFSPRQQAAAPEKDLPEVVGHRGTSLLLTRAGRSRAAAHAGGCFLDLLHLLRGCFLSSHLGTLLLLPLATSDPSYLPWPGPYYMPDHQDTCRILFTLRR